MKFLKNLTKYIFLYGLYGFVFTGFFQLLFVGIDEAIDIGFKPERLPFVFVLVPLITGLGFGIPRALGFKLENKNSNDTDVIDEIASVLDQKRK